MKKEKVLKELKEIAQELNVDWKDSKVLLRYNEKHPEGISIEICKVLIHPVYFPKDQCQYIPEVACEWPEETGEIPWYDL